MNWWDTLLGKNPGRKLDNGVLPECGDGYSAVSGDTQAAIAELSQVVRSNPDAVEIYLALGNLYRSHGEIERAVQIRQSLIVRPGLDKETQAKAWFELGRDFKRGGFLDRAMGAFEQARSLSGDRASIVAELARLTADSGDHERAARYYAKLGHFVAEAHHMVRIATERFAQGQDAAGFKWLRKALKVHPGALEAWQELMRQDLGNKNWLDLGKHLDQALESVQRDLRFVLMEGLIDAAKTHEYGAHCSLETEKPFQYYPQAELTEAVLPVLERQDSDLLLQYYAAWMVCGTDPIGARRWLERTLVLNPSFWPARLELLALDMADMVNKGGPDDHAMSESFRKQLEFFILRARELKRFVCRKCGLKREQIFYVCPRCRSWHSIKYRTTINE